MGRSTRTAIESGSWMLGAAARRVNGRVERRWPGASAALVIPRSPVLPEKPAEGAGGRAYGEPVASLLYS